MATMTEATITGERMEELQSIASEHLFMHAQQVEDWRGQLKIFVKGEGAWVEDIEGNRLLDALGGLWYKAAGYGRRQIADAMYEQIDGVSRRRRRTRRRHTQIELAGRIASLYHDKDARTFFLSGGSEAVETAVKMAKKYQALTGKAGAFKVISRQVFVPWCDGDVGESWDGVRRLTRAGLRCRARFM